MKKQELMKPCIIVSSDCHWLGHPIFKVINESGKKCESGFNWVCYQALRENLMKKGYVVVSHNSRCGRTILDKLNGEFI